jgi:ATP-dependent helicase/nuclease subunit A
MLPRELVLASAGTGKTFRISSRIIGLLAAGVPPESIFASTFTRKAAGEILDRVLARIAEAALDGEKARELAKHVWLGDGHEPPSEPREWLRLLERLVRALHRVNIGTLDAFFVRTALSFGDEIELPPSWSIADAAVEERVRSEALQEVLSSAEPDGFLELVRGVSRGDAARSVHDALLRNARALLDLHHALDPEVADPWGALDRVTRAPPPDFAERQRRLVAALRSVEPPLTKGGKPNSTWAKALAKCADRVEAGEWVELLGENLCGAALEEGGSFSRIEVPSEICSIFREARELARYPIGARIARQSRALGRLAEILCEAVDRKQRELGAYGFGDVTRHIGGPEPLCGRPDLHYRLDARTEHILLDEFQDTSLAQWEALEPLLDELLSGHEGERAAVVVADPKQSIYAWRGGEPLLVRHVGELYELKHEGLHLSYRSSQVVLDAANHVFEKLPENAVFIDDPVARQVASDWSRDFTPHAAAKDLPGHFRVEVGPDDEGRGSDRPNLCRRAARLVAELRSQAPGLSIGVLTRRNRTVAQIMLELRHLGVPASEEGGNPLTDSAAAASLLALLRMVDHPGDTISRYHVAMTPVGEVVGLTDHADTKSAYRVAAEVRARLVEEGYGHTLERLARRLGDSVSHREARRLAQLVELAFRFDARATLRTSDFLRVVEQERVEDPTTADVRVMTVHQSKGLEFDVVVLPELDTSLNGQNGELLAFRPHPAGRITHAFPYVGETIRDLYPEVPELTRAAEQARAGRLRDGLSGLYVALTRARHALHLVIRPDGRNGMGSGLSGSRLVRCALDATGPADEGAVLFEAGNPFWYEEVLAAKAREEREAAVTGPASGEMESRVRLRADGRARSFIRRTPSELAGGDRVDLRMMLNLDTAGAALGTLVHAWLEEVEWIEDGFPSEARLRAIAGTLRPEMDDVEIDLLATRIRDRVGTPEIHSALSRARYPAGAVVEREAPFAYREGGTLIEGVIDRLVILRQGERVIGAEIVDFKTDAVADPAALEAKVAHYAPQMAAYRRGVAAGFRIPEESVRCRLLFLEAGTVREV